MAIGMVESFSAIPGFVLAKSGALAAGTQDGNAKVIVQAPPTSTGSGEATMAQNLETSLQPDGFAPNPCVLEAWNRSLASLVRSVPNGNVAAWDCQPIASSSGTSPVKTYVGTNTRLQSAYAAKLAIQQGHLSASTTGTALVGNCATGVPSLVVTETAAVAVVKRLLPKVSVVGFSTALAQGANTAAWTSQLSKYQHVVFAMGACTQDGLSLITLKQRHTGGNFVASILEPDTPLELKAIKSGLATSGVTAAPWVYGNVVIRLLIAGARGHSLPQGWVNTGMYPITKANAEAWIAGTQSPSSEAKFFTPFANKIMNNLSRLTKPMGDSF